MQTEPSRPFISVFYITLTLIPFAIVCFCTCKILVSVSRAKQRVEENLSSGSRQHKRERLVTLMLLPVIITFFIFIAPVSVVGAIKRYMFKNGAWINYSTVMIALLNHVNNPIIYGLMNRNFRQAVLKLFCKKKDGRTLKTTPMQEVQPKE